MHSSLCGIMLSVVILAILTQSVPAQAESTTPATLLSNADFIFECPSDDGGCMTGHLSLNNLDSFNSTASMKIVLNEPTPMVAAKINIGLPHGHGGSNDMILAFAGRKEQDGFVVTQHLEQSDPHSSIAADFNLKMLREKDSFVSTGDVAIASAGLGPDGSINDDAYNTWTHNLTFGGELGFKNYTISTFASGSHSRKYRELGYELKFDAACTDDAVSGQGHFDITLGNSEDIEETLVLQNVLHNSIMFHFNKEDNTGNISIIYGRHQMNTLTEPRDGEQGYMLVFSIDEVKKVEGDKHLYRGSMTIDGFFQADFTGDISINNSGVTGSISISSNDVKVLQNTPLDPLLKIDFIGTSNEGVCLLDVEVTSKWKAFPNARFTMDNLIKDNGIIINDIKMQAPIGLGKYLGMWENKVEIKLGVDDKDEFAMTTTWDNLDWRGQKRSFETAYKADLDRASHKITYQVTSPFSSFSQLDGSFELPQPESWSFEHLSKNSIKALMSFDQIETREGLIVKHPHDFESIAEWDIDFNLDGPHNFVRMNMTGSGLHTLIDCRPYDPKHTVSAEARATSNSVKGVLQVPCMNNFTSSAEFRTGKLRLGENGADVADLRVQWSNNRTNSNSTRNEPKVIFQVVNPFIHEDSDNWNVHLEEGLFLAKGICEHTHLQYSMGFNYGAGDSRSMQTEPILGCTESKKNCFNCVNNFGTEDEFSCRFASKEPLCRREEGKQSCPVLCDVCGHCPTAAEHDQCNSLASNFVCTSRTGNVLCPNACSPCRDSFSNVPDHKIKLVGGQNPMEGNVMVYSQERHDWFPVCDDDWGDNEARVVCQELGFSSSLMVTTGSRFGPVDCKFAMDNVECVGDEQSLSQCPFNGWFDEDCGGHEAAGVICQE